MSVRHATWTIERAYVVPPARVFDVWIATSFRPVDRHD